MYVTRKQLVELSKISRATVTRKITKLKAELPDIYKVITKKEGKTVMYKQKEWLSYLTSNLTTTKSRLKSINQKVGGNKGEKQASKVQAQKQKDKQEAIHPEMLYLDVEELALYKHLDSPKIKEMFQILVPVMTDYKTGLMTIEQACDRNGVSYYTIYKWLTSIPDLKDFYRLAKVKRRQSIDDQLSQAAETSLMKLVKGYDHTEVEQQYTERYNPYSQKMVRIPKEGKMKSKHITPNASAVMFALVNKLPDYYKNANTLSIIGNVNPDKELERELADYSLDDLQLLLNELKSNDNVNTNEAAS